jgi:hypothetical protein
VLGELHLRDLPLLTQLGNASPEPLEESAFVLADRHSRHPE